MIAFVTNLFTILKNKFMYFRFSLVLRIFACKTIYIEFGQILGLIVVVDLSSLKLYNTLLNYRVTSYSIGKCKKH